MLTYDQAVKELFYSLFGSNPTNFHAVLYLLIQKADSQNLALLSYAYPMEVQAYQEWQKSKGSSEFFKKFGFQVPL